MKHWYRAEWALYINVYVFISLIIVLVLDTTVLKCFQRRYSDMLFALYLRLPQLKLKTEEYLHGLANCKELK